MSARPHLIAKQDLVLVLDSPVQGLDTLVQLDHPPLLPGAEGLVLVQLVVQLLPL